jgi:hypothetical protein
VIDWLFVARHALWIVGAAIVLAAWSFGRVEGLGAGGRTLIRAGALLFCLGFALTTALWQALLWSLLALFAALETWRALAWHRQPH